MRDRRGPTRCSFCGRKEPQVGQIVAGPGVYICNECIDLCQDVVDTKKAANKPSRAGQISALRAEIRQLYGLLRLESRLVKDLRAETERLKAKPKARPRQDS